MTLRNQIRQVRRRVKKKLFSSSEKIIYTKDLLGDRYKIGDYTYGIPRVDLLGEGASLRVGKYCSIGTNVTIFLGSEHHLDWVSTYPFPFLWPEGRSIPGHPFTKGDIVIGNDVWIGFGATLLSGVTIGDGLPWGLLPRGPRRPSVCHRRRKSARSSGIGSKRKPSKDYCK